MIAACAAALAVTAWLAAAALEAEPSAWLALSRPLLRRVAADAIVLEALAAAVAAPLVGVALRSTGRRLAALVGFIATSLALSIAAAVAARGPISAIFAAHATLATGALAFVALGAASARIFRDELDAAGGALVAALVVTAGLLAAGPSAADLPTPALNAALAASPLVATASAAGIDLLRTEALYQLSPLGQRRFDYPSWPLAAGSYVVAAACLLTFARSHQKDS